MPIPGNRKILKFLVISFLKSLLDCQWKVLFHILLVDKIHVIGFIHIFTKLKILSNKYNLCARMELINLFCQKNSGRLWQFNIHKNNVIIRSEAAYGTVEELVSYIKSIHNSYMKLVHTVEEDIRYIVHVCTTVVKSVLNMVSKVFNPVTVNIQYV